MRLFEGVDVEHCFEVYILEIKPIRLIVICAHRFRIKR
jgi:hypothetical protein